MIVLVYLFYDSTGRVDVRGLLHVVVQNDDLTRNHHDGQGGCHIYDIRTTEG